MARLNHALRSETWRSNREEAIWQFEQGNETAMWMCLLLAEDAIWAHPQSARQKEAQRLWQQRGTLERLFANLRIIRTDPRLVQMEEEYEILFRATKVIGTFINRNQQAMSTIKERIPS